VNPVFRCELVRDRSLTLFLAGIHFGLLIMLLQPMAEDSHRPALVLFANVSHYFLMAFCILGVAYGLFQMGLHRRAHAWIFLIQRPVPPRQTFFAIAAASGVNVLIVTALPWLIAILFFDVSSSLVVESRHYLHAFYLAGMTYACVLAGQLAVLLPFRYDLSFLVLLLFPLGHPPAFGDHVPGSGLVQMIALAITVLWIGGLATCAFKPDLDRVPIGGWLPTALHAVPLTILFLALLYFATMTAVAVFAPILPSSDGPPENSWRAHLATDQQQRTLSLLDGVDPETSEAITEAVSMDSGDAASARARPFPRRDQLYAYDNTDRILENRDSPVFWAFSNREMLYRGMDRQTGAVTGWLGPEGVSETPEAATARFARVPSAISNQGLIFTRNTVWRFDPNLLRMFPIFQPGEGEEVYGRPSFNRDYLTVASNTHLYLFSNRFDSRWTYPREPIYRVPLPRPPEQLSAITIYPLVDGILLYYRNDYLFGGGQPGAILQRAHLDGRSEIVVAHRFTDFAKPVVTRLDSFAISPLLHAVIYEGIWGLLEPEERRHRRISLGEAPLPYWWWLVLGVVHLSSAIGVFWWTRRDKTGPSTRALWVLLCLAFGAPAIASFASLRYLASKYR